MVRRKKEKIEKKGKQKCIKDFCVLKNNYSKNKNKKENKHRTA